jgi:lipoate-protein ligase B
MHGLAVNVDPDLGHFDTIVPCGLAGRPVTSIARELGPERATIPDMAQVTAAVEAGFARHLSHPEPFRDRPASDA